MGLSTKVPLGILLWVLSGTVMVPPVAQIWRGEERKAEAAPGRAEASGCCELFVPRQRLEAPGWFRRRLGQSGAPAADQPGSVSGSSVSSLLFRAFKYLDKSKKTKRFREKRLGRVRSQTFGGGLTQIWSQMNSSRSE